MNVPDTTGRPDDLWVLCDRNLAIDSAILRRWSMPAEGADRLMACDVRAWAIRDVIRLVVSPGSTELAGERSQG